MELPGVWWRSYRDMAANPSVDWEGSGAILPGTRRGTTRTRGGGGVPLAKSVAEAPSVSASRCHLRVPGRIGSVAINGWRLA